MFRNYLKTGWRNLLKNKFYSFINIAGLTIGLAIGILIPSSHSPYLFCGLVALVLAFLCALWRFFFLKLPFTVVAAQS